MIQSIGEWLYYVVHGGMLVTATEHANSDCWSVYFENFRMAVACGDGAKVEAINWLKNVVEAL